MPLKLILEKMASKRKSSESDFAPEPKRSLHHKSAGGKNRSTPLDVEAIPPQAQRRGTPAKAGQKKTRPSNAPSAQQGKARRREDDAKPSGEVVKEFEAHPAPTKPKPSYTLAQPFPTREEFQTNDFPIFEDGDILICLGPDHMYMLHSSSLNRPVSFFKDTATDKVEELCRIMTVYERKMDFVTKRRFVLTEREDGEGYYLKRMPFTKLKDVAKPRVVVEEAGENKESGLQSVPDAPQVPAVQGSTNIAATSSSAHAATGTSLSQDATQNIALAGPATDDANAITNGTHQASAPPSTASSQTTSVPSSSQTPSNAATAGTSFSAPASRPAPNTITIKQENGIKTEVEEDDDGFDAPSSSSSSHGQLGIDLGTLKKHVDGRPIMEMNGKICYISAIDPADPQQRTSQSTINFGGLVYQFTPVEPVKLAAAGAAADEQAHQNEEEDEDTEEEIAEPLPPKPCLPLTLPDWVFGFDSLLNIIYNHPTSISTSSINDALLQCEALIAAAKSVGALRVVSAHIGNAIMNFGKMVYISILENPKRWLRFAVDLKHVAILNEAVIHVVGTWPDLIEPWTFDMLNEATLALVKRKAEELRLKTYEVNERLFAASLDVGSNPNNVARVELDMKHTQSFDSWFVVQLWRNWYSDNLSQARTPRTRENSEKVRKVKWVCFGVMVQMGALFRLLDEAGNAYLKKGDVVKLLDSYKARQPRSHAGMTGFLCFMDWEEDLKRMKDFAKEVVKDLIINNSMLTPQEHGIQYFTCTTVSEEERPWDMERK